MSSVEIRMSRNAHKLAKIQNRCYNKSKKSSKNEFFGFLSFL